MKSITRWTALLATALLLVSGASFAEGFRCEVPKPVIEAGLALGLRPDAAPAVAGLGGVGLSEKCLAGSRFAMLGEAVLGLGIGERPSYELALRLGLLLRITERTALGIAAVPAFEISGAGMAPAGIAAGPAVEQHLGGGIEMLLFPAYRRGLDAEATNGVVLSASFSLAAGDHHEHGEHHE